MRISYRYRAWMKEIRMHPDIPRNDIQYKRFHFATKILAQIEREICDPHKWFQCGRIVRPIKQRNSGLKITSDDKFKM